MRFSTSLLLPTLLSVAQAADVAKVFLLSASRQPTPERIPTLSPSQARLVFAQRLDVAQYHNLENADDKTLEYINVFGGNQHEFFGKTGSSPSQLLIAIDGNAGNALEDLWKTTKLLQPLFEISGPASKAQNVRLTNDLVKQSGGNPASRPCPVKRMTDPFDSECWGTRGQVLYLQGDEERVLTEFLNDASRMSQFVENGDLEVLFVTTPTLSNTWKSQKDPYGSYDMPSPILHARRETENPLREESTFIEPIPVVSKLQSTGKPQTLKTSPRIIPLCHTSADSCNAATNNCTGHGSCVQKYGPKAGSSGPSCWSCTCGSTFNGNLTTHWGGSACAKQDISSQFWLLASFSVILVGLVSYAIGMLFSVGEEKLPGVIGAGVSVSKTRL